MNQVQKQYFLATVGERCRREYNLESIVELVEMNLPAKFSPSLDLLSIFKQDHLYFVYGLRDQTLVRLQLEQENLVRESEIKKLPTSTLTNLLAFSCVLFGGNGYLSYKAGSLDFMPAYAEYVLPAITTAYLTAVYIRHFPGIIGNLLLEIKLWKAYKKDNKTS